MFDVVAQWSHLDEQVTFVTIDGELIETTPWHDFYTDEGWQDAGELVTGNLVLSLDGDYGVVDSVRTIDVIQRMYDLTVADAHTFAVGTGQWVVHNQSRMPCEFVDILQNNQIDLDDFHQAIESWTKNEYDEMRQIQIYGSKAVLNKALLAGKEAYTKALELIRQTELLENAIKILPKYDGTIFRRIDLDSLDDLEGIVGNLEEGSIYESTSFQSFSRDGNFGQNRNTLLIVENNISGVNIQTISNSPLEAEILVPKSVRYEVVDIIFHAGIDWPLEYTVTLREFIEN